MLSDEEVVIDSFFHHVVGKKDLLLLGNLNRKYK